VPDKRTHRGPHPSDSKLFGADCRAHLQNALTDYAWLLTRGYAEKSALKLVGDRFALTKRQRLAVMRCACSDPQRTVRAKSRLPISDLLGQSLAIDGYNVLITIEAALSGGLIFKGRDGCLRDLAGIHGTYRKVDETIPALKLIGDFLKQTEITHCLWLLDSPVSNSGRLKTLITQLAEEHDWPWDVQLLLNPDTALKETSDIVATSDSVILDHCGQWINLAEAIIAETLPKTTVIDLSLKNYPAALF